MEFSRSERNLASCLPISDEPLKRVQVTILEMSPDRRTAATENPESEAWYRNPALQVSESGVRKAASARGKSPCAAKFRTLFERAVQSTESFPDAHIVPHPAVSTIMLPSSLFPLPNCCAIKTIAAAPANASNALEATPVPTPDQNGASRNNAGRFANRRTRCRPAPWPFALRRSRAR